MPLALSALLGDGSCPTKQEQQDAATLNIPLIAAHFIQLYKLEFGCFVLSLYCAFELHAGQNLNIIASPSKIPPCCFNAYSIKFFAALRFSGKENFELKRVSIYT